MPRLWFPWAFKLCVNYLLNYPLIYILVFYYFSVVNYTFLSQICGDFSIFFEKIDPIIHYIWFMLVHWEMLPIPLTNRS